MPFLIKHVLLWTRRNFRLLLRVGLTFTRLFSAFCVHQHPSRTRTKGRKTWKRQIALTSDVDVVVVVDDSGVGHVRRAWYSTTAAAARLKAPADHGHEDTVVHSTATHVHATTAGTHTHARRHIDMDTRVHAHTHTSASPLAARRSGWQHSGTVVRSRSSPFCSKRHTDAHRKQLTADERGREGLCACERHRLDITRCNKQATTAVTVGVGGQGSRPVRNWAQRPSTHRHPPPH